MLFFNKGRKYLVENKGKVIPSVKSNLCAHRISPLIAREKGRWLWMKILNDTCKIFFPFHNARTPLKQNASETFFFFFVTSCYTQSNKFILIITNMIIKSIDRDRSIKFFSTLCNYTYCTFIRPTYLIWWRYSLILILRHVDSLIILALHQTRLINEIGAPCVIANNGFHFVYIPNKILPKYVWRNTNDQRHFKFI